MLIAILPCFPYVGCQSPTSGAARSSSSPRRTESRISQQGRHITSKVVMMVMVALMVMAINKEAEQIVFFVLLCYNNDFDSNPIDPGAFKSSFRKLYPVIQLSS